jgi:hypothetical protein
VTAKTTTQIAHSVTTTTMAFVTAVAFATAFVFVTAAPTVFSASPGSHMFLRSKK